MVVLLPMAVTNLRAKPASIVSASDASNWGEAGVTSKVPFKVGEELIRHTLRKSVWTRLLGPAAAWLRAQSLLPECEELPGEEENFTSNPLWSLLADGLVYKELFSKQRSSARHINVGELRAALKTEKLLSLRNPSSRQIQGLDSQVALGALIKGRSSSAALNEELGRSVPWMLALDSYAEYMYFHTSLNRADQPTRGQPIKGPGTALPGWWDDVANGKYAPLDEWLYEHGLDADSVGGLPPLSELCGDVSPSGILPRFMQRTHEAAAVTAKGRSSGEAIQSGGSEALPSSSTPAQPLKRTALYGRAHFSQIPKAPEFEQTAEDPIEEDGGMGPLPGSSTSAQPQQRSALFGRGPVPSNKGRSKRVLAPLLSKEAREALQEFPLKQFVLATGVSWPPVRAGFLDLYSGERGVAKSIRKKKSYLESMFRPSRWCRPRPQ